MAKINIRPTSSVYATYKRLSYQPWTAIAEFVDNSTQSFFDHKKELLALPHYNKLNIDIEYKSNPNGEDVLTISDSAFGMEWEDFERAIVLDSVPSVNNGRNEFGMGLKTAACWFGRRWSVISTQLGSDLGYKATIDVDKLKSSKDEEIDADIFEADISEHYTKIVIENLSKKLTASRTVWKIKELLGSIYRQDIRSGNVVITYNGTELVYSEPVVYEEELPSGTKEKWTKDINFTINHEGTELSVAGFIAIRIPASLRDAGFTLLRRGRVIIGGPEQNYRPVELFGDPNSYAYQRLFGELHMDNWPVTQAKDDFDWHNSGLEEQFIEKLSEFTKPYRIKSEQIRVRQRVETNEVIRKAVEGLQKADIIRDATIIPAKEPEVQENTLHLNSAEEHECDTIKSNSTATDNALIIDGPKSYQTDFEYMDEKYVFRVEFEITNPFSPWMVISQEQDIHVVRLNMRHPFFAPFIDNKDFTVIITKFMIAMALAEVESNKISYDGRISSSEIRTKMNKILEELATQP